MSMRKILRRMTKHELEKHGVEKVNRRMSHGRWRKVLNAYPIEKNTRTKMPADYCGVRGARTKTSKTKNIQFVYPYGFRQKATRRRKAD